MATSLLHDTILDRFPGNNINRHREVILVTGASGFIGGELVRQLEAAGYCIVSASRRSVSSASPSVSLPDANAPESAFEALLDGVDHVVHLAAIHHAKRAVSDDEYYLANCVLTAKLAKAAHKRINGKFVFTSSIRAQCGSVFDGVLRESDPPQPTEFYGQTKLAAEAEIAAGMPRRNYTILRPVLVYGPNATGNLGKLMRLAALPILLPLKSLPGKRSLLDRGALCAAILHSFKEPKTDGETFIVADRRPVTLGEMVAAMRRGMGRRELLFAVPAALLDFAATLTGQGERRKRLGRDLVASSAKLEATGWQPVEDPVRQIEHLCRSSRPIIPASLNARA